MTRVKRFKGGQKRATEKRGWRQKKKRKRKRTRNKKRRWGAWLTEGA